MPIACVNAVVGICVPAWGVDKRMKTKKLALNAMLTALTMVLLTASSVLPSGRIAAVVLAGVPVLLGAVANGGKSGIGIYVASSILGLLILPGKAMASAYLLLFGLYPLVQYGIEKRQWQKNWLKIASKLLAFMVMLVSVGAVALLVFKVSFIITESRLVPAVALGLVCVSMIFFLIYDKGLIVVVNIIYRRMKPLFDKVMGRKGNGL